MNAQRTAILTHFGPLFTFALGGWTAFNLVDTGSFNFVPGVVVAFMLAYAGTLVALRLQATQNLRATYPPVWTSGQFPTVAHPRHTHAMPLRPARDDMDIAAGD